MDTQKFIDEIKALTSSLSSTTVSSLISSKILLISAILKLSPFIFYHLGILFSGLIQYNRKRSDRI